MEYIIKYWSYLTAVATVFVYCFDKVYIYLTDKKKKKQAYNRIFVAIIKLFYSYQKHKNLYKEIPSLNLSNEIYATIAKHLDSFHNDLESFKDSILKESEIIPEISIESHLLFENADRMRIMDRMSLSEPLIYEMTSEHKLITKRAQFHAIEDVFDNFFNNILQNISKHTSVKKDFIDQFKYFRSAEYEIESSKQQREIMLKYFQSLLRQEAISDDEFRDFFGDIIGNQK